MEIERKYLIRELPDNPDQYPCQHIRQAYVCTSPVIRVRQKDDQYILTLKGGGMLAREEVEMPLSQESFQLLYQKKEGMAIDKHRYRIPDGQGYTIELDIFHEDYQGFVMAEVEFPSLEASENYSPPSWFGQEVTMDKRFHNSTLSSNSPDQVRAFMDLIQTI